MVNYEVTQFASETIAAVNNFAIHNDTAAYTCTKGNHDEVLHTASHAIGHFAHSSSVGIVRHAARHAEGILKHLCNGHNAFPNQVGCVFNVARVEIAVGCTDTHTFNIINTTDYVQSRLQCFNSGFHVIFYIGIGLGLDGGLRFDSTALVNDTKNGVRTAHIKANHIGFFDNLFHKCIEY